MDQQPSVSMAYYTSPTSFQRQLVFQNFSSAMIGNYTCTTIDGSRTLLIGESKCMQCDYIVLQLHHLQLE